MHPYHHAASSALRFGGELEDYLPLHRWFDDSKQGFADSRHRAIKHHREGIAWAVRVFGETVAGIPTQELGEQHVMEDLGEVPSVAKWWGAITLRPWMERVPVDEDGPIAAWFGQSPYPYNLLMHFHAEGIFWLEHELGVLVGGVPTRVQGERYVSRTLQRIPTLTDWLRCMKGASWMSNTNDAFKRQLEEVSVWLADHGDQHGP